MSCQQDATGAVSFEELVEPGGHSGRALALFLKHRVGDVCQLGDLRLQLLSFRQPDEVVHAVGDPERAGLGLDHSDRGEFDDLVLQRIEAARLCIEEDDRVEAVEDVVEVVRHVQALLSFLWRQASG